MVWNPNATVTVAGVEYTGQTLNGLAIHYGRPTIWDQARSSYATISILNTTDTDYAFEINDTVVVEIQDSDGTEITVFTGKTTDISNAIQASGANATVAVQTITAVGPFAQMARAIVGTTNYPKEYDDDRITRILTEAGVTIDVVDTPGVYELQERQSDPQDAYTLATYYAGMCFGYMYETKTGSVGYANESRRTINVNNNGYLDIDEGYINWRGINSRKSISDIVNRIILFYKNGQSKTAEDTASISNYGLIEARINTELEQGDQAQNISDRYVSLRSVPETNFSSFSINLDNPNLTALDLDDLINIEMGTALQISNLPNAISSINYTGFVEGWVLVIDQSQALLTLTTSDSTYSVVPIRWQDVDPTIQWEDIDPTATRSTKTNLIQNPSFEPVDYGQQGYVYVPGILTYGLETPDAAALDITGDIDIRAKIAPDDWTPAATQAILGKDSSGNRSYIFGLGASGALAFTITANGTTNISFTSTANLSALPDGTVKWVRVTLDVDNGAGGKNANFYTSDDGTLWTQLGTTVTSAGTTNIFSGTASLTIGQNPGSGQVFKGKLYAISILNGINGTEVFQFDVGGNWKSTDIDSFTAQTGQTISLSIPIRCYGWSGPGTPGSTYNFSRSTAQVSTGTTSGLYTQLTTAAGSIVTRSLANLNTRIPVANGDTIYFAFKARRNVGTRNARARIFTYNSTTSSTVVEQILGSSITLSNTAWTVCQVSGTLTNANSLYMDAYIDILAGSANESLYVDAIIVEKNSGGYAAYYFDGSYSDIPADRNPNLGWSGTQNFSSSTANAYWGTKPTTLWQNVDTVGLP